MLARFDELVQSYKAWKGRVPILGEYLTARLVEDIAQRKLFRVAQKGEIHEVLQDLELKPALFYTKEKNQEIGKSLKAQAIMQGRLTDLGTNLDVRLTLIDVVTGEVIASATENLNRTKFAMEMLKHF